MSVAEEWRGGHAPGRFSRRSNSDNDFSIAVRSSSGSSGWVSRSRRSTRCCSMAARFAFTANCWDNLLKAMISSGECPSAFSCWSRAIGSNSAAGVSERRIIPSAGSIVFHIHSATNSALPQECSFAAIALKVLRVISRRCRSISSSESGRSKYEVIRNRPFMSWSSATTPLPVLTGYR